ncbi:HipA domain-containing protein [Acidobacteria bacterium AH-259-O06]|nr:HipA domain-containing protein [Acidobacteria bacterium AH-259-O06]
MFCIITVPDDAADLTEPLGTKPKFWFRNNDGVECLFKERTRNTGEDWSEKVACELCSLLGLPHASYDFATYRGRKGVVSPTFVPDRGRLVPGNELLASLVKAYPGKRFFGVSQHTLRLVLKIVKLDAVQVPLGYEPFSGVDSAVDFFVGYLMLDAWIANQDRHHENWALIVTRERTTHLAPSYDHASSLGRNETEANREDRLTTRDVGRSMERYVERAKSAFFASPSGKKPMPTLEAFQEAAKLRPEAAKSWIERLEQVSSRETRSIFEQIPEGRITSVAIEFAQKLLELNRQRIVTVGEELR